MTSRGARSVHIHYRHNFLFKNIFCPWLAESMDMRSALGVRCMAASIRGSNDLRVMECSGRSVGGSKGRKDLPRSSME